MALAIGPQGSYHVRLQRLPWAGLPRQNSRQTQKHYEVWKYCQSTSRVQAQVLQNFSEKELLRDPPHGAAGKNKTKWAMPGNAKVVSYSSWPSMRLSCGTPLQCKLAQLACTGNVGLGGAQQYQAPPNVALLGGAAGLQAWHACSW